MRPGTTLCIPAWNGEAFVAETLAAAVRQDVPGLVIHVSVDGADQATAEACRPFLDDPRIRLTLQPRRLGWVGNSNWLIAAADTRFVAMLPHDDVPEPGWLAALHGVLAAAPEAVCAFADLRGFGARTRRIDQAEIRGPILARLLDTLLHQRAAVAYRGLLRLRDAEDRPFLPTDMPRDIAADTAWLMELACRGEVRRVPEVLVAKRYHAGNTHGAWGSLPPAEQVEAQAALAATMTRRALAAIAEAAAPRGAVVAAALLRLAGCGAGLPRHPKTPPAALIAAYGVACPEAAHALPLPPRRVLIGQAGAGPLALLLDDPATLAKLAVLGASLPDATEPRLVAALGALAAGE